ncbi:hypothetical protein G7Z17_g1422 [Cylindrodendrum hubeiense]|uniref:Uncharacterized protein n=1 Tax=Cylindrodendrum hubeiense TaxID=595255 RepID=A0A9P5HJG4_9HYPO|nr:hypothetical protein G7Z17_g1422 [Cylindrodendrum hubeiense]
MVSNKSRLYIALYPSGVVGNEERRYHWGFLVGPKAEDKVQVPGMRYHVKNHPSYGWVYEEVPLDNIRNSSRLMVRVLIAKVEDEAGLADIFRSIPIVQNDPNWRCRTWVANALARIEEDGRAVGTSVLDWRRIEAVARQYAGEKTRSGRYLTAEGIDRPKPTWDMLQDRETVQ